MKPGARGFTLVEVIIAMGISAVLIMAITHLIDQSLRSVRYVSQKLSVLELEKLMLAALADGQVCTKAMQDAIAAGTPYRFNRNNLGNAQVLLPNLPVSTAAGAPTLIPASRKIGTGGLTAEAPPLAFRNFQPNGTNKFIAELMVRLESSSMPTPITWSPIRFLLTTDAAQNATILTCTLSAPNPHGKARYTANGTWTAPEGVSRVWVTLAGGGGGGAGDAGAATGGGNGGNTCFDALCVNGGRGGTVCAPPNPGAGGAAGGSGGGPGTPGVAGSFTQGGSSVFGAGGLNFTAPGCGGQGAPGTGFGAGGAGGSDCISVFGGGGGGAEVVIAEELPVVAGQTYAIAIGAGGAGGNGTFRGGGGTPGFCLVEY